MRQGWEIKKLGDVCELINGYAFQSKQYTDEGYFVIRIGNVQDGYIELNNPRYIKLKEEKQRKFILQSGDILISLTGNVGRVGAIQEEHLPAVLNQRVAKIAIKKEQSTDKEYLSYFLSSEYFISELIKAGRGAAQQNISTNDIESLEIPLPPLPEQLRIVSILDECFAAIEKAKANAEQNLKNAKELFESYLQRVFENKGESWEEKTLGDIGKPLMCKRILKNQTSSTGEIPFYKIGTFGKTPNAFISKEIYNEYRTKYSFPKKGDILISASGTIGRRVRYDGEPAFFQDSNIVWIDNDEKQVLNDYLYVFYEFCDWQPSKGATIARLYNSNLISIKIVFPKSLVEQKNILKKINALSAKTKKLEAIYQKKTNDLEELKKSVLQKAFAGELKTSKKEVTV